MKTKNIPIPAAIHRQLLQEKKETGVAINRLAADLIETGIQMRQQARKQLEA